MTRNLSNSPRLGAGPLPSSLGRWKGFIHDTSTQLVIETCCNGYHSPLAFKPAANEFRDSSWRSETHHHPTLCFSAKATIIFTLSINDQPPPPYRVKHQRNFTEEDSINFLYNCFNIGLLGKQKLSFTKKFIGIDDLHIYIYIKQRKNDWFVWADHSNP